MGCLYCLMQAFFCLKPVSLIEEIIRSINLDNLASKIRAKGEKRKFGHCLFHTGVPVEISELTLLRSVSQKSLKIVCCVCLMDTTCPYGAVATELGCFETWQAACISRVDVDMQCCCFLLAKDLMTCWHCWSWTSTRCLSVLLSSFNFDLLITV